MTSDTLQKEIEVLVPMLLNMARELSWNNISSNCKFILTEIKNNLDNFHLQRQLRKKENNNKFPLTLQELTSTLQSLYEELYDINLHIFRISKHLTIIEISYYLKSSLDPEFRQLVLHNPPMLHCKVAHPPWLTNSKEKFDINWEHRQWLINWKLFWARRKLKHQKRLT